MNFAHLAGGRKTRRIAGAVAVAAAAAGAGAVALSGTAAATTSSTAGRAAGAVGSVSGVGHREGVKPTVVLEHGAFADASSWNGVIERLEHEGYPVIAAANPLRGPAQDAAALRTVIDHTHGPVVLVGHSYGGSVISEAAVGEPRVKALVYVAAFLPAPGESALELTNKFPGSTLPQTLDPVPFTLPDGSTGTDLYIKQDAFPHQFAADVPKNTAALMAATQRPIAQSALEEKATVAAWQTIPSWDVITTEDLNIPPAAQRFMAERAHAHVTEVPASHSVAVSHPGTVAQVIEQAARTTVH